MNDCTDDIMIRIASYGEASDLFRLALACKRFGAISDPPDLGNGDAAHPRWSLMEEAARRILLQATKSDAGVIVGAYNDWMRLKELVAAKSGDAPAEAEDLARHPAAVAAMRGPTAAAEDVEEEQEEQEEEQQQEGEQEDAGGAGAPPGLFDAIHNQMGFERPVTPPGFWEVVTVKDEPSQPAGGATAPAQLEAGEISWMGLYRELELVRKCNPRKIAMLDFLGGEEQFQSTLERFEDPESQVTKISICGPEYDAMGVMDQGWEDDDWEHEREREFVPEERIEKVFRVMATMPNLLEIVIDPGYYAEDGELASSRLCWLLSPHSNYRTLRISDLDVHSQSDVERLAEAFAANSSIQTLCIDPIHIGYRDVTTVVPLMKAIAHLPKLKRLRLTFDAFGHGRATNKYVQQSLPILRASLRGISAKARGGYGQRYPEVSNCTDVNACI